MIKKKIYARQEIEPVLQAYALRGTSSAAAKELNKLTRYRNSLGGFIFHHKNPLLMYNEY